MVMFGWDFEVDARLGFWRCLIKICVWTCDMTQEVTLVSRTQPSGPLCLWQCFFFWKVERLQKYQVFDKICIFHRSASWPDGSEMSGKEGEKSPPVHELWLLRQSVEQPKRVALKITIFYLKLVPRGSDLSVLTWHEENWSVKAEKAESIAWLSGSQSAG